MEKVSEGKADSRNYSLDLLRIISMLMIILMHSIDHSGVLEAAETAVLPAKIYVYTAYVLTRVSVNCFIMISGYFMVRQSFRPEKLLVLWMEVVFYSLFFRILFIGLGMKGFSPGAIFSCFIPVLTGRYWFVTIYFGLCFIAPFLNIALKAMSKRQHLMLMAVLFLLFPVWSAFFPFSQGMNSGGGWGLAWFSVLYLTGAWFRNCYRKGPPRRSVHVYFLLWGAAVLIPAAVLTAGSYVRPLRSLGDTWNRYDSPFVYAATLLLFTAFLHMKEMPKSLERIVKICTPAVFGVYLIHAHADVSPWIWNTLALPGRLSSPLFPVFQLSSVAAIFLVCCCIDAIRRKTVGLAERSRAVSAVTSVLTGAWERILSYLERTLLEH